MNAGTSSTLAARRGRAVGAAAAFLLPFAVYLFTLSPGLNFEDAAEFALGGATLGVDHPSGYPLETHVVHLFTHLPAGDDAWRANVSSAFCAALAAAFLFLFCWEILTPLAPKPGRRAAAAWLGAAAFALSRSFWPQAVITEVYALNAAAVAAACWAAAVALRRGDDRWLLLTIFVAALGAANHPASLVLTAPLALYVWSRLGRPRAPLAFAAALVALALSIYLYLALRASREPALNWGLPYDLPSFLDHVRRREFGTIYGPRYRYLGFHAWELARLLFWQFGPALGVLAPLGLWWLWRRRSPGGLPLTGLALLAGPFMLFPLVGLLTPIQVFEIEVWYIPFFMFCAAAAAAAVGAFAARLRGRLGAAVATGLALLALYPLAFNFARADGRERLFAAEYTRNLLRTYPYRTVITFPFYERLGLYEQSFLRAAEGRRPDVDLVDSRASVPTRFAAVRRAPRFILDPDAAMRWWFDFRRELWTTAAGRPNFANVPAEDAAAMGVTLEPFGFVFYVRSPQAAPPPGEPPWNRFEHAAADALTADVSDGKTNADPTSLRMLSFYFGARADYYFARGREDEGLAELRRAATLAPLEPTIPWFVAGAYDKHDRPDLALPLYRQTLAQADRYRYDAKLFRMNYAGLLNALALAYVKTGDVAAARACYERSLAVLPDQPAVEGFLTPGELETAAAYFARERAEPSPP